MRDVLAVRPVDGGGSGFEFEGVHPPEKQGNPRPIAYGGCAVAQAIVAGFKTIADPESYFAYSITATYLGPASPLFALRFAVVDIRSTRTFCTRQVSVTQATDPAQPEIRRTILVLQLDTQRREPSFLEYSRQPSLSQIANYKKPDELPEAARFFKEKCEPQVFKLYTRLFPLTDRYFQTRDCRLGPGIEQVLGGKFRADEFDLGAETRKKTAEKRLAMWCKTKVALETHAEQCGALGFYMDGILAFLPLIFAQKTFADASASSSLELALRIFSPELDLNRWTLQECESDRGGFGRTYSRGRLWDLEGNLLAEMSQQSILRPAKL